MLRLFLSVLGVGTTLIGLLASMRRLHHRVFIPQLVVTEYAWFFTLFNAIVTVFSFSRRATLGWGYGILGTILAATPLFRVRLALRDMDQAMRQGFGPDYERCIPPTITARISTTRFTWDHPFATKQRNPQILVTPDVPFVNREKRDLKMDVYEPPFAGPHPAILVLHGGGWQNGDKSLWFDWHDRHLAAQGYVVFDAQYRFSREARWPAQLDDVQAAIHWIIDHAAEYDLDPTRIALLGRSAGGHLALQAAYRFSDLPIRAVIAAYAPSNLRMNGRKPDHRVVALLGAVVYDDEALYADASPIDFAQGEHLPPTLLLHGYIDDIVPPSQSEMLLNRLRAARTPAAVLRVPWGHHGFDGVPGGMGAQITQYYMDRFLAWSFYRV